MQPGDMFLGQGFRLGDYMTEDALPDVPAAAAAAVDDPSGSLVLADRVRPPDEAYYECLLPPVIESLLSGLLGPPPPVGLSGLAEHESEAITIEDFEGEMARTIKVLRSFKSTAKRLAG